MSEEVWIWVWRVAILFFLMSAVGNLTLLRQGK